MRHRVYLGVTGSRDIILKFAADAAVVDADVRPLVPPRQITNEDLIAAATWRWRTRYWEGTLDSPEDEIPRFLEHYRDLTRLLNRSRNQLSEVYLCMVMAYEEGEAHRGHSISHEIVRALADLGAALEIDAVSLMS